MAGLCFFIDFEVMLELFGFVCHTQQYKIFRQHLTVHLNTPFHPCGFKDPCYIFAVQPIKIDCKANQVTMGLKFKQFNSTHLSCRSINAYFDELLLWNKGANDNCPALT